MNTKKSSDVNVRVYTWILEKGTFLFDIFVEFEITSIESHKSKKVGFG